LMTGLDLPGLEAVRDRLEEHLRALEQARRRLEEVNNFSGAMVALQLQIPVLGILNDLNRLIESARTGGMLLASNTACMLLDKAYNLVRSIESGEYSPFGVPVRFTLLTLISLLSQCSSSGG